MRRNPEKFDKKTLCLDFDNQFLAFFNNWYIHFFFTLFHTLQLLLRNMRKRIFFVMKKMASSVLKSEIIIKSHPDLTSPLEDYSSVKTADELYSKIHKCLAFQPKFKFSLTHVDRSKENFFIDVEKIDRIYHFKASGNFYKLIARMLVNNHFMIREI